MECFHKKLFPKVGFHSENGVFETGQFLTVPCGRGTRQQACQTSPLGTSK